MSGMAVVGIDVGGTFTDAVLLEGGRIRTAKVSTSAEQEEGVIAAAHAVGCGPSDRFTHGTTVATNAFLERKGAPTALVTNDGFEHLLHLRRQNRADLYKLGVHHPEPLVPLHRSYGVVGRIGPEGERARRSNSRACPRSRVMRSQSAFSSPFETWGTSGPSPRSCGGATPTSTSSPRTRSRRSSGSTSEPPRPQQTHTSALSCLATCARLPMP